MPKEIEIRNKLFNEKDVVDFFNKKGINHVNDWIRLRNEDGILSFNYKHWLPEEPEVRTYCEEKEYIMNSKEDFKIILSKLGFEANFKPIITVYKLRTSFLYKNCEVSIDKIKSLGTFKDKNILEVQNFFHRSFKKHTCQSWSS